MYRAWVSCTIASMRLGFASSTATLKIAVKTAVNVASVAANHESGIEAMRFPRRARPSSRRCGSRTLLSRTPNVSVISVPRSIRVRDVSADSTTSAAIRSESADATIL